MLAPPTARAKLLTTDDTEETARSIRLASILTLVVCVAGFVAIPVVNKTGLWMVSLFYDQFIRIEPIPLAILGVFAVVLYRMTKSSSTDAGAPPRWLASSRRNWLVVVLGTLVIAWIGTHLVFHAYAFVDDEYSGWFQGVIYSRGVSQAVVPQPWCQWIAGMTPTSIQVVPPCTWRLSYLPIHSMIRGAFLALHADSLAEPVMAALSVWLVLLTCRRKYPTLPEVPMLAALMLAASAQFLVMSMTAYAMPAHLLASTLWLYLYVRPERWAVALVPWVGVLALGVHSPYPHLLFVAPLVLAYLAERRFLVFTYNAVVYFGGLMFWTGRYLQHAEVGSVAVATPSAVTSAAGSMLSLRGDGITGAMTFALFATWAVPVALVAILLAFLSWKRLDLFAKALAASFAFNVIGRALFFGTQGAGWGARFFHASIANAAILAALGMQQMIEVFGTRRTYRLVGAALATALIIELPMRGFQAERIVRPYVDASRYLESIDADVVVAYFEDVRWGRQLLRNDPFLRTRPILMGFSEVKQVGLDSLKKLYPGRVRFVSGDELHKFIPKSGRVGRLVFGTSEK